MESEMSTAQKMAKFAGPLSRREARLFCGCYFAYVAMCVILSVLGRARVDACAKLLAAAELARSESGALSELSGLSAEASSKVRLRV